MIQQMLAIWSLIPLPFLNPAWTSGSSWFTYYWSLAWRILSITLLACEMNAIVQQFEYPLPLPFLGIGMKTDIFQSCGHCWVFQICWHIEYTTFTASAFRIWNSSIGIPSPPLPLLIVILPKAHLTSHPRRSGSRWVTTPSWLSGSWRSFYVFLPPLLNIFCLCLVHTIYVLYCGCLCMKCSLVISNFLEEISSLSHSIVFLYFFALITVEAVLSLLAILWNSVFKWVYLFFFSFAFHFSSFHSYLKALHRQPFFPFPFLFLGDGLDPCLPYNITNLHQ